MPPTHMHTSRRRLATGRHLALAGGLLLLLSLTLETVAFRAAQTPATVPSYRQAQQVAVLTMHGEVDQVSLMSLERRLAQALEDGADAIVLDLDTPGGRVDIMRDIVHLIRTECPANTVAWINPSAYSAGTLIALASREIVVHPDAAFGDVAPIQITMGSRGPTLVPLPQAERDKMEAPLRAEAVESARRNGYDENLVQAFISVGVELWLIENIASGEQAIVTRAEYKRVMGTEPADDLTPVAPRAPPGGIPDPPPIRSYYDQSLADAIPMTEAEIQAQIELQQERPPNRAPLTEAERGRWRPVRQIVTNDRLLTIKAGESLLYGLAAAVVANDAELAAFFGTTTVRRYDRTWSEGLVRFLINIYVRAFLVAVVLIGFFLEMAAPGLGIFGSIALVALMLLIGAPLLAGMAQWWDILLIIVGVVLIVTEIFLIPGLGIPGVVGALCLLAGLVGTFVTTDLSSDQGRSDLMTGLVATLGGVFTAGVGIWLLSRQFHSLPILNRLIVRTELGGGLAAAGAATSAAAPATSSPVAVGDVGVAVTDLRPAGRARFGKVLTDVQSLGRFIDAGTPIRAVAVRRYVIDVEVADS